MKGRLFISLVIVLSMITAGVWAQDQNGGGTIYTVKPGDIPDLIAAQYDVDLLCLIQENNLPPNGMIFPGDKLVIPTDCPHYHGASPVQSTREIPVEPGTYLVQPGDVVDLIAGQNDVDTLCLMQENNLAQDGMVYPDQVLIIPANCPHYRGWSTVGIRRNIQDPEGMYVVQPGDTLDSIARAFNVSLIALEITNNLPDGFIPFADDVLEIPADAPPYGTYPPITLSGATEGQIYVIQPGDVPDLLAAFFNVKTQCLIERNQIDLPIHPGLVLRIPSDCPKYDGFSTPRPEQIRGLGLLVATATRVNPSTATRSAATLAATQAATATTIPATPTLIAPTATLQPATITPTLVQPTATPTFSVTPGGNGRPPTITPTAQG